MCLRFVMAYLCMLPFCHEQLLARSWRDEALFVLLGMSGGSLYFLAENYAVKLTDYTSTVALIVCTCPIWTALLSRVIWRQEKIRSRFVLGSVLAMTGVSMVVLNGVFVLDDNPWVILLSFTAALLWAVYSILIRHLENRYTSAVITRKVFFWGMLTMAPVCAYEWMTIGYDPARYTATVWITVLFLALLASLAAFWIWNIVCKHLSIVTASNYLYFNPLMSLLVGAVLLGEQVTIPAVVGALVTIGGVYLCNKK